MQIIDTHCHLDFHDFDIDRDEVFKRARNKGIVAFVVPAVKSATWDTLIQLCEKYEDAYYALGLHPMFIQSHKVEDIDLLNRYLQRNQAVAVGEIGLDFYDRSLSKENQVTFFERQLEIATELHFPVILHVRKAHEEVLAYLKKYPVPGGIVHAYNGSLQQAERYMSHNFKFGFGGMLTYERSAKLRNLAQALPLETIVLETDSPDMTVQAHRGERNSPEYLPDCLTALAQIRGASTDVIAQQTTHNAYELFARLRE